MTAPENTPSLFPEGRRVKVLLPLPLAGAYDYLAPEDLTLRPGSFVTVPLGSRQVTGVVWDDDTPAGAEPVAAARLKAVEAVLAVAPLPEQNRRFIDWIADYCVIAPGAVLRMAMSVPKALEPPKPKHVYALAERIPEDLRRTPARNRVLALLRDGPPRPSAELANEAGVSSGVVKGLAGAGALVPLRLPDTPTWPQPDPERPGPDLSDEQHSAAEDLAAKCRSGGFSVSVLDGITGSGKTEVYFEAIAETLRAGRSVLVLLPEIALSAQWLERFEDRFGVPPAEWHSDLGSPRRRVIWRAVSEGRVPVMVGARSALHLPHRDLGLIVVDEEHDGSFKQEDGVIYHARDMAVVRARLADIPVVLVSATPSLETLGNVKAGRYTRLALSKRHGGATLPDIHLIDLKEHKPPRQNWLSQPLRDAVDETLSNGQQALLFLNRRGYAPLTLCRTCGHRLGCPNCQAWLVEHRFGRRLECHHCGYRIPMPTACPECGDDDGLAACGPGVERLSEEAMALFPDARLEVVTSDTLYGPVAAAAFVDRMTSGETNLVIGTQIVAKGYHFPLLTLVGVVDADLGLAGGDLRAAERTYQLLSQVAGRAGRAGHAGRVLIQTANPEASVMRALESGDRDGFIEAEAKQREDGAWPPFGRLAALIVSGPEEDALDGLCRHLARTAPKGDGLRVLGPAPAPLALLRGRFRRRFLIRADRGIAIQQAIRDWLTAVKPTSNQRIQVDIDPYSFM